MRKVIKKTMRSGKSPAILICCIEDDYEDVFFIDKHVKSDARYIITSEGPVKKLEMVGGGYQLTDVIQKLKDSYFTDNHRTTLVRTDIHDFDNMM
ncbi:MAG: hypothetical protein J5813_06575, partial [Candidatus Methanomethylophilaceae archaeon]|nr:hypothetical protein [Candidatus Methanomethylophilaceae archaeon]